MTDPIRQFETQRVLVTGASGFIGKHLCARLIGEGAAVHAVSRRSEPSASAGLNWWKCDVTDVDQVRSLFAETRPEVIYHLASFVSGSRDLEAVLPTFHSNLVSTVNLLALATELGCRRIVLAGSMEEPRPDEKAAVPGSPYAAAKMAGSAYARMFHALYRTPVVIAKIFMVYGPGQGDLRKLVPYVTLSLLRGEAPKLSSGTRPVDWIYVDDVVEGLLASASAPGLEGETVELGSGSMATVREVVEMLVGLNGSRVQPVFGGIEDRPFEQVRTADIAATYAQMSWRPETGLEEGLRQTVEWYGRRYPDGKVEE